MGDEELVYRNCRAAQASGEEIDHATARVIGSWYADGTTLGQPAFVTTGAILDGPTVLWDDLTWGGRLYDEAGADGRLALDMLGTYLLNRADHGPVPGWSEMWVR